MKLLKQRILVKMTLEARDVALLTVVPAVFVEYFNEDGQESVGVLLANHIGFLVDIEQDALRGDRDGLIDKPGQFGIAAFAAKDLAYLKFINLATR